jgi:hypothetical protein
MLLMEADARVRELYSWRQVAAGLEREYLRAARSKQRRGLFRSIRSFRRRRSHAGAEGADPRRM